MREGEKGPSDSVFGSSNDSFRGSRVLEWEETSDPKIPRGWPLSWQETRKFLRFIGLGIVVGTLQGFQSKLFELKKVILYQSRIPTFLRALVSIFFDKICRTRNLLSTSVALIW